MPKIDFMEACQIIRDGYRLFEVFNQDYEEAIMAAFSMSMAHECEDAEEVISTVAGFIIGRTYGIREERIRRERESNCIL